MKVFCTYFDRNFLAQGITLIRSIEEVYIKPYMIIVLCIDYFTFDILKRLNFQNVQLVKESELIDFEARLRIVKHERPLMEYYYCFTPILIKYSFSRYENSNCVIYIDADVYFFNNFGQALQKYNNHDMLLFEHGTKIDQSRIEHGLYNVGFNFFRRSENCFQAVDWWTDRVLESTARGNGVWGDQKYLDKFPEIFEKVGVVNSAGMIAAPWNISAKKIHGNGSGVVYVNDEQLIMYHFARLLVISKNVYIPIKRTMITNNILELIYKPYLIKLSLSFSLIKKLEPAYKVKYTSKNLKGVALGLLLGRGFYLKRNRLKRLGINIPFGY